MSFVSGAMSANAAEKAGDQQAEASKYAADLQYKYGMKSLSMYKQIYEQGRKDFMPWLDTGRAGLKKYWDLLQNPESVTKTPGYDFRMKEGMTALDRSAAGRGRLMSGGHSKDLVKFGQDYATNEYDTALNRFSQAAGMGLGAVQSVSNVGSQYGARAGEALQGLGNALGQQALNRGSAYGNAAIGQANAWSGASSNAISGVGTAIELAKLLKSSRTLKTAIANLANGLEVVLKLRPVAFVWKETKKPDCGFVAEEIAEAFPFAAAEINGVPAVNPYPIVAVLVSAVQNLATRVLSLEQGVVYDAS